MCMYLGIFTVNSIALPTPVPRKNRLNFWLGYFLETHINILLPTNAKCRYFCILHTSFIYIVHANQYIVCYAIPSLVYMYVSEWKRLTKCEMRHYFPREHLLTPLELELAFLVFYCDV